MWSYLPKMAQLAQWGTARVQTQAGWLQSPTAKSVCQACARGDTVVTSPGRQLWRWICLLVHHCVLAHTHRLREWLNNCKGNYSFLLHQKTPSLFYFETRSHCIAQPKVQWHDHISQQPWTPGLKQSSQQFPIEANAYILKRKVYVWGTIFKEDAVENIFHWH